MKKSLKAVSKNIEHLYSFLICVFLEAFQLSLCDKIKIQKERILDVKS